MIDRRAALGGLTTAIAAPAIAAPAGPVQPTAPTTAYHVPPPLFGPRINFAQADKVMSELGLDAIVLGSGVNFYQATGLDLTVTRMGHAPPVFAVITRNEKQRLAIVAPAFLYYYTIALDHGDQQYPAFVYTAPASEAAAGMEPSAQKLEIFNDRKEAPLDQIESGRAQIVKNTLARHAEHASAVFALRKAFAEAGVSKGRIAADLMPVQKRVAEALPGAEVIDADDAMRRIRPVKSAIEIELMRHAAQMNCEAAREAVQTVRAGGDVRDLRAAYFAAVARRGGRGVFMVIDRVSSPNYEAKFRDGQCFSIDCVSEFMGYHGDYARAVYIGDPPKNMLKVSEVSGNAWEAVRETLKPGVTFKQIIATGKQALKKMGSNYNISFTPHSVGLYHDDRDGSTGLPPQSADPVLEAGMVMSIDCPLLEAGAGGSSHLEDLTLITANGSEPLNDISHKTIMI